MVSPPRKTPLDENTKIILTTILTSFVTFVTGNGLWNYVTEKMRRKTPTLQERVEVDNSNARVALEIIASLRQDVERLQKEIKVRQDDFEKDLALIRGENSTMRAFYEDQIKTLKADYETRIAVLKHDYEVRIQKSEDEADNLRKRIATLEEERQLLLQLSEAFEKAKKAGTISGD